MHMTAGQLISFRNILLPKLNVKLCPQVKNDEWKSFMICFSKVNPSFYRLLFFHC